MTGTPAKKPLSACLRGGPQARNLFSIVGYLQKQTGVELHGAVGAKAENQVARKTE